MEYGKKLVLRAADWLSALTGYAAVRDVSPRVRAGEVRIEGFTCYSQVDTYSCGAVSGFQVVKTFYPDAVFGEFYEACGTSDEGTYEEQLLVALDQFGIDFSVRRRMSFKTLRTAIKTGKPVIITVKNKGSRDEHLVTIYGFGTGYFLLSANGLPWIGTHRISDAALSKIWHPKGNGIVCWRR